MRAGGGGLGLIALGFCSGVREAGSNRRWPERRALSSVCSEVREAGSDRRGPERGPRSAACSEGREAGAVGGDFRSLPGVVASREATQAPEGGVVPRIFSDGRP